LFKALSRYKEKLNMMTNVVSTTVLCNSIASPSLKYIKMKRATVLIFGEVLVDVFPEQTMIGGAPYNVARHLKAFGLTPLLLTKVGKDVFGDSIMLEMQAHQLSTEGVQRDALYPTGQVQVTFAEFGHQFEILPNQAYDHLIVENALSALSTHSPDMFYLGTLALRSLQAREVVTELLTNVSCPIFCDINLRAPWYCSETIEFVLNHANIVKINHEELAEIAPMLCMRGNAEEQARHLQKKYDLTHVFVTCGEAGSWWLDYAQEIRYVETGTCTSELIDSVGAGDAYSAAVMLGLLHGWQADLLLRRASDFAASICGIRGAVPSDATFYQKQC